MTEGERYRRDRLGVEWARACMRGDGVAVTRAEDAMQNFIREYRIARDLKKAQKGR